MKEWTSPELTALVRNKSDEAVLGACKTENSAATSGGFVSGCARSDCLACQGNVNS